MAVREYIGARYVPKFSDVNGGVWDNSYTYEPLTIVKYGVDWYTSKKAVPVGAAITDSEYWVLTGNTNGAIISLNDRVTDLENAVDGVYPIFVSVAAMKIADLEIGDIVQTVNYYEGINGGGATYIISDDAGTDDGGSVILLDNGLKAFLVVFEKYVTPEQFGAKSDYLNNANPTDDSLAIQKALNFCGDNDLQLKCLYSYYIDDEMTVPPGVTIFSDENSQKYFTFYIGPNVSKVFSCEVRNVFVNISICGAGRIYRNFIGIEFTGNNVYNIDATVRSCIFIYCGTCLLVKGRNVNVYDNLFSHSKYGVYFDLPSAGNDMRGLNIQRCRFHGIGEESALNFEDSAGIYIYYEKYADLIVQNCLCDMSGRFIEGYTPKMNISNNVIQSYVKEPIYLHKNEYGFSQGVNVYNNEIRGLKGADGIGVDHPNYPDYGIKCVNIARMNIRDNLVYHTHKSAMFIDTCSYSVISGNTFSDNTNNDSNNAVLTLETNRNMIIENNSGVNNTTKVKFSQSSDGVKYTTAYVANNFFFDPSTDLTELSDS